ncbi:MAG: T9SS type A sorting domain-containing protein [Bacteroidales bacterium]
MKHLFTIVLLALALSAANAQSKFPNDNFIIPNGDFEHWHTVTVNATLSYDDIGTDATDKWMATLNSLVAVPPIAGGPGPATVFKSTDSHLGSYAAKAVSANFPVGPTNIFIPGMIGTAQMDMVGIRAVLGQPCPECRPSRLKGFFKFEPVNGDSCAAVILLSKWNSTAKKRDTIGFGKFVQHTAVGTYTQFDVPVNYTGAGVIDSMTMLVVSSAGFNVINFVGSVGQIGNTMYVDDLVLDYPNGIQQVLMPEVSVNAYPNPVNDALHVDLSKEVKEGVFKIYNMGGQPLGTFYLSGKNNVISTQSLVSGSYYYRLMSGKEILNSGTFIVKK